EAGPRGAADGADAGADPAEHEAHRAREGSEPADRGADPGDARKGVRPGHDRLTREARRPRPRSRQPPAGSRTTRIFPSGPSAIQAVPSSVATAFLAPFAVAADVPRSRRPCSSRCATVSVAAPEAAA